MNNAAKWIVGIVAGLVIVCGIAAVIVLAGTRLVGADLEFGTRMGRLWGDDQGFLWRDLPGLADWDGPMYWNLGGALRFLLCGSCCIGLVILLALVFILVIRNQNRASQKTAGGPPEQRTTARIEAGKTGETSCSNCGREVQENWNICPHCGNNLSI